MTRVKTRSVRFGKAFALTLCSWVVPALVWGQSPKLAQEVTPAAAGSILSVVTSYSGADIGQNTWVEIRGTNLVPATTPAAGVIWSNAPEFKSGRMPTNLQGISVTVNGKNAYIYFFCSSATDNDCAHDQINVLTPLDNTLGGVQVVVNNNGVNSAPFTSNLRSSSPSFFQWFGRYAVATHVNGSLLGPTSLFPGYSTPALPGETITLWMTGFGLPTTTLVQGSATQSGQLPAKPVIQFNGTPATILYAAVVSPGLYQINLTLPSNISGDVPVAVSYNGITGPTSNYINVAASSPTHNVTVHLTNSLVYPVDFSYNGSTFVRVDPQSSADRTLAVGSSMQVGFNMVQPTLAGRALGDPISGNFDPISNPSGTINLTLRATLSNASFFAPRINNTTGSDLLLGVNMGLQAENRCNCTAPANTSNVQFGYYRYYSNSNVRAYLPGTNYSGSYEYFGQDPNTPAGTINGVDANTGLVTLTFNQVPSGGGGGGGGGGGDPAATVFLEDATTLQNQGSNVTQDFTLGRQTTLVFRLASDYSVQAAIMTPDQKSAFLNNQPFSGYAIFDKKFGTQSVTLPAGSYFVGVRNATAAANSMRYEVDYDVSFPGLSRYDSNTFSQNVGANGGKYYQGFSIQTGFRYWVDGCNSGMDVFLIPESELNNFLGNKTFTYYSDYSGNNNPELPGGYEVKLPPGNYYFAFRNQSSVGKVFTFTIERWR